MKRFVLLLSIFFAVMLSAQTVDFTLREHANKNFSVSIYNGLKVDTIARGRINMLGDGKFVVPEKYKNTPAMGVLNIDRAKSIDLILNKEDFSFSQSDKGVLSFKGSRENDLFYNRQSEVLNEENKATYVYSYVKMLNAVVRMRNVIQQQGKASLFDQTSAKIAVLNDVDVDKLYYSRFWFFAIDGLLRLSVGQEGFANDMIRMIDKTKTDRVLVALVEDIIMIVNQYGLDDAFDMIIPYVQKSGRIEYPQGNIYDAFAMAKVLKGTQAPTIDGLTNAKKGENKFTLVVFHQPGCDNCHEQLAILKSKNAFFEQQGVRIVTISGALDKQAFDKESKEFPWADKLCDYNGFAGTNFMRYGVIGTPTLYLIDSANTVLGRFAMILDVENYIRSAL